MHKLILAAAAAMIFAVAPASAMGNLKCNTSSMKKVDAMIGEMEGDKKMKKMVKKAMGEAEMAMKAKEAGNKKECAMHLNMAEEALMAK